MNLRPSQHLAAIFRQKIADGQWTDGVRLPTTKQLSKEYRVSPNTIQGAFRYLEAEDLVERRPRRGGFVKAPKVTRELHIGKVVAIIAEAVSRNESEEGHNWCYWIARAAERELGAADHHILLFSWVMDDPTSLSRMRKRLDDVKKRLAGVICFPMPGLKDCLDSLRREGIPAVTINRLNNQAVEDFVSADNVQGGRLVGEYFGRMGYEQVVFLSDVTGPGSSVLEKYLGFLEGYIECGFSPQKVQFVACGGYHDSHGYTGLAQYIEQSGWPRGIFTSGDFLALGAMRLCHERGFSIPDQVGIVGASGLNVAQYSNPPLTVLAQPMDEMGSEAAKMLLEMIQQNKMHMPGRFIESSLIQRQSFTPSAEILKKMTSASRMEAQATTEVSV